MINGAPLQESLFLPTLGSSFGGLSRKMGRPFIFFLASSIKNLLWDSFGTLRFSTDRKLILLGFLPTRKPLKILLEMHFCPFISRAVLLFMIYRSQSYFSLQASRVWPTEALALYFVVQKDVPFNKYLTNSLSINGSDCNMLYFQRKMLLSAVLVVLLFRNSPNFEKN